MKIYQAYGSRSVHSVDWQSASSLTMQRRCESVHLSQRAPSCVL